MNKRIEELAEQAVSHPDMFGLYHFGMKELERFAELIARECADIFSHQMKDYRFDDGVHLGLGDVRFTVGMEEDMVQHIKEHFGVEE